MNIVDEAYSSFLAFMRERIAAYEAQASKDAKKDLVDIDAKNSNRKVEKQDIFTRLVAARQSTSAVDGEKQDNVYMTDEELIGNLFLFVSLYSLG